MFPSFILSSCHNFRSSRRKLFIMFHLEMNQKTRAEWRRRRGNVLRQFIEVCKDTFSFLKEERSDNELYDVNTNSGCGIFVLWGGPGETRRSNTLNNFLKKWNSIERTFTRRASYFTISAISALWASLAEASERGSDCSSPMIFVLKL